MTIPRTIATLLLLILLIFASVLIAWLLTCGPEEEDLDVGDPKVYHVSVLPPGDDGIEDSHKPEWVPRENAFNILFLGDGFQTNDQLDAYRSTVYELAKGLISRRPFCHYTNDLDFYRIDLRDPSIEFPQPDCPADCDSVKTLDSVSAKLASVSPGQIVRDGTPAVRVDLGATRCWTSPASTLSPACYLFWTGAVGQEKAYRLAQFLPEGVDIEVVVIVVNALEYGGAGLYNVDMGIDRLVVLAVELEKPRVSGQNNVMVSENTHLLFAHELGHALGLLDEYHVDGQPPGEPDPDRNVWHPQAPGALDIFESQAVNLPPWSETLPHDCTPDQMAPCCGNMFGDSECHPCAGLNRPECYRVPGICQDPGWYCASEFFGPCALPQNCLSQSFRPQFLCAFPVCDTRGPGAWEGAVYARKGYYRARESCRMGAHLESEFCEACAFYLRQKVFTSSQMPSYRGTMERCPEIQP